MALRIIDGAYEACHNSDLDTLSNLGSKRPTVLVGAWTPCRILVLCFPVLLFVSISNSGNDPDTPDPSLERYVILTPFILVFIISILFPILSDSHAAEIAGVAYLFVPVFEGGLIAMFLVAFVIIRLFRKNDLKSS